MTALPSVLVGRVVGEKVGLLLGNGVFVTVGKGVSGTKRTGGKLGNGVGAFGGNVL